MWTWVPLFNQIYGIFGHAFLHIDFSNFRRASGRVAQKRKQMLQSIMLLNIQLQVRQDSFHKPTAQNPRSCYLFAFDHTRHDADNQFEYDEFPLDFQPALVYSQ